jgi:hypothetical protein
VFGNEFESLASHALLNYSEPENSVWLLLPEHRQLGQTAITDQELYAKENYKFVVCDKTHSRQPRAD